MPRSKKPTVLLESLSRKRARLEIEEAVQNAQRAIGENNWKEVYACIDKAYMLSRGLRTMPVELRKLKMVPCNDPRISSSAVYSLELLALFTPHEPVWGIAEMAAALGASRSTTHRYAQTLVMCGQLEQTTGRKYRRAEG